MYPENGILKGEMKVAGGKLIKCRMTVRTGIIVNIKLSGDFFMHPEEKIDELEEKLAGCPLDEKHLRNICSSFFEEVELIGATPEDFIAVMLKAHRRDN